MQETAINTSGLNFSPHFWYKAIDRGISFTEAFAKDLYPDINFRQWLNTATVEHPNLDIYDSDLYSRPHRSDFAYRVSNEYYHEVATQNRYGHKVSAKTVEQLHSTPGVEHDSDLVFSFKIDSLQHLATTHLMNWIILGTDFQWTRWQLYFDFIVRKSEPPLKEMFYYMWSIIMGEIEHHHNFFETVENYKRFRDHFELINEQAGIFDKKFIALRDTTKPKTKIKSRS